MQRTQTHTDESAYANIHICRYKNVLHYSNYRQLQRAIIAVFNVVIMGSGIDAAAAMVVAVNDTHAETYILDASTYLQIYSVLFTFFFLILSCLAHKSN